MKPLLSNRKLLGAASRIVIKVGSSSLTAPDGSLDETRLAELVDVVALARARGQEVLLVSSGAVAAGIKPLGFNSRPKNVRDQQAAAMVGQSRLMHAYATKFASYGITIGQVLLTPDDVIDRRHYANAQGSLKRLLHHGVVPIVNENDAVVSDDLRFGDNDRLAALVAHLVDATALVLCTDVEGLFSGPPNLPDSVLISEVLSMAQLENLRITGKGSDVGTGGMRTKVAAADIATAGGIGTLLVSTDSLRRALEGEQVGTWFVPRGRRTSARSLWMKYSARISGTLIVDDGAAHALRSGGASLLAVGIKAVRGSFAAGDMVEVCESTGQRIAVGMVAFSNGEVEEFAGLVDGVQRGRAPRPIIHVDDLVC
ncbi:glutamate 5-kinase [Arcanobacterium pluranimalium]|uniref:glutamate 5-kinase n=1 Tax=Arcanobacterium pluranimalium TaxID=108028 RepID=UPI00195DC8D3|nr:glutamate 5-kinase [Arcanobacterium pluranimalium]MBM7825233.1 glutamate 5-kinase [Arcanobacterium pluranimalium]